MSLYKQVQKIYKDTLDAVDESGQDRNHEALRLRTRLDGTPTMTDILDAYQLIENTN